MEVVVPNRNMTTVTIIDSADLLCSEENGHISSCGHARKGEYMVRRILWSGDDNSIKLVDIQ